MVMRLTRMKRDAEGGYTLVEFALASLIFLMISLGTIDVGRSIFLYSQLHSAVRDAAREAKVGTANGSGFSQGTISHRVLVAKNLIDGDEFTRAGLSSASVSYTCGGSCSTGDPLTVNADLPFQSVIQDFLGISPITLTASSTVTLE
jgi:hypothetical protein